MIVDADTGYGNAINVERTVRLLEKAGAHAIQIEDQGFPKRCGHLDGKTLIPAGEMAGKIAAAVNVRHSSDTLIIARTDAVAVEGFDAAIERALLYREAGADLLFVEAPKARSNWQTSSRVSAPAYRCWPIWLRAARPDIIGARTRSARLLDGHFSRRYRALAGEDRRRLLCVAGRPWQHAQPFRDRMLDFDELNGLIGTPEMVERAMRLDTISPGQNR